MKSVTHITQTMNTPKQIATGPQEGSESATSITAGMSLSRDRCAMNIMFAAMGFGYGD